ILGSVVGGIRLFPIEGTRRPLGLPLGQATRAACRASPRGNHGPRLPGVLLPALANNRAHSVFRRWRTLRARTVAGLLLPPVEWSYRALAGEDRSRLRAVFRVSLRSNRAPSGRA